MIFIAIRYICFVSARLRYDGVYVVSFEGDVDYLRFYPDGLVLDVVTDDPIIEVAGLLDRDKTTADGRGTARVTRDAVHIVYDASPLEYRGTIGEGELRLRDVSDVTSTELTFVFHSFEAIAAIPARIAPRGLLPVVHDMYVRWLASPEIALFHERRLIPVAEHVERQGHFNSWIEKRLCRDVEQQTGVWLRAMVPFLQRDSNYCDYCLFANQGKHPDAVYLWFHDQPGDLMLLAPTFREFLDKVKARRDQGKELYL